MFVLVSGSAPRVRSHGQWRAVAEAGGTEERQSLCQAVFQGGEEELALLEAVKLLMLSSAAELHARMGRSEEVPAFCWLLFARDDSGGPREFLANHLSQVGFGGGLEQVSPVTCPSESFPKLWAGTCWRIVGRLEVA